LVKQEGTPRSRTDRRSTTSGYISIAIERILTDNGNGYRSHPWARRCAELGIRHTRTRPYHPATNGKVCEDLDRCCIGSGLTLAKV